MFFLILYYRLQSNLMLNFIQKMNLTGKDIFIRSCYHDFKRHLMYLLYMWTRLYVLHSTFTTKPSGLGQSSSRKNGTFSGTDEETTKTQANMVYHRGYPAENQRNSIIMAVSSKLFCLLRHMYSLIIQSHTVFPTSYLNSGFSVFELSTPITIF